MRKRFGLGARLRSRYSLAALLLVGLLVLAACGEEADEPEPDATATPTTATSDATEPPPTTDATAETEPEDETETSSEGSDLGDLIAAAQEEGELVVYGAPAEATVQEWVAEFEAEYGIPVNYFRQPSNPIHQRWAQETEAGQHLADVVMHSLPLSLVDANEAGWIAEYFPTESDAYPDNFKVDGRIYPLYLSVDAIGWNTEVVTEQEAEMLRTEKLDALRDPAWDGRIALVNMAAGGPQLANYQQLIDFQADEYGWEYIEDIATNDPVIYDSGVSMVEAMVAGEHAVSFTMPTTIAAGQVLQGAPIQWTYRPNPSAGVFNIVVSANAPSPNAARLFLEWATSLEGQEALVNINQGIAAHADWVDQRPISDYDWYVPYEGEIYLDWAFDTELAERAQDYYDRYNEIMGLG